MKNGLINYQHNMRREMSNAADRITHKVSDKRRFSPLANLTPLLQLLHCHLVFLLVILSYHHRTDRRLAERQWKWEEIVGRYLC